MTNKRKKILYLICAVIAVMLISLGTTITMKMISESNNQTQNNDTSTKASADSYKNQAINAMTSEDYDKALSLFKEAEKQYRDIGDTNNAVDASAQIHLLENLEK